MLSLMVKMAKKGTRPTISNPTIIVSIPILIASVMVTNPTIIVTVMVTDQIIIVSIMVTHRCSGPF